MLRYTGHPLVDVGAAAIAALVSKSRVDLVDDHDFEKVGEFIERNYVVNPMKSFLNVAFPNSGFTNPAFESSPQKRVEYAKRLAGAYKTKGAGTSDRRCVFTGQPAATVAFSDKLMPGRAFRQHIPLVTGEGVINFHPWGDAGVPISGEALLCIQFFPMGCAKCGGRLLAVHSDSGDIVYEFAAEFLRRNQAAMSLAQQTDEKKMPEAGASAKTLLIETLLKIERRRIEAREETGHHYSVTAYHLTNSGQSNPLDEHNSPLQMYHLPLEITGFLAHIVGPAFREDWARVEARGRGLDPVGKRGMGGKAGGLQERRPAERNRVYEDLFDLPWNAGLFVRRYFLRIPGDEVPGNEREGETVAVEPGRPVSWKLVGLFLKKVMAMEDKRVDEIRSLGDGLANYVATENDRRFFSSFYVQQNYEHFRTNLIRANLVHVKRGNKPLIRLDPFIEVFEEGDEVARSDWRLARDLILIRMIEKLHESGWLSGNPDAIPVLSEDGESDKQ